MNAGESSEASRGEAAGARPIEPASWPRPSGYSNAILVPPGHGLLVMAGQIGWNEAGQLVDGGFVAQFERALANVATLVEAAGGEPCDVIRLTIFVVDKMLYLDQLGPVGQAYRRVLGRNYPCMSLVEVRALVEEGALVEIEATAALPADRCRGET